MISGIIIGLSIAGAIWYVHKVGLPTIKTELQNLEKAIIHHAQETKPTNTTVVNK